MTKSQPYNPRFTHKLGDAFVTDTHTNERIEFKDSDAAYFGRGRLELAAMPAAKAGNKMRRRQERKQGGQRV